MRGKDKLNDSKMFSTKISSNEESELNSVS